MEYLPKLVGKMYIYSAIFVAIGSARTTSLSIASALSTVSTPRATSRLDRLSHAASISPWLNLAEGVQISADAYGGCGVVIRAPPTNTNTSREMGEQGVKIPSGTELLFIDGDGLLWAPKSGIAGRIGKRAAELIGAGEADAEVFSLCAAMLGYETDEETHDHWNQYRSTLPWESLRTHPLHWTPAQLEESPVYTTDAEMRLLGLGGMADALAEAAASERPSAYTAREAVACCLSRVIRTPRSQRICAAPFLELINHSRANANCSFREGRNGSITAVATRELCDGEDVLVDYGDDKAGFPKSPEILFAGYGIY